MSYTTSTAYNQGENAAISAFNTGVSDGLGTGTVIYDDIEAYDTGNSSCVAAVNSFVGGWDYEMKTVKSSKAGMYGSSSGSDVAGWASVSPAPSDVYAADYNGVHSVWNLTGLPNADWVGDHRSHQYSGNVYSTYGGIQLLTDPACGLSDVAAGSYYLDEGVDGSESSGPTEDPSC